MLGSLVLYFKGMRLMMLQLSGFYCMWGFPKIRGTVFCGPSNKDHTI